MPKYNVLKKTALAAILTSVLGTSTLLAQTPYDLSLIHI